MSERSGESGSNARLGARKTGLGRGLDALIPSLETIPLSQPVSTTTAPVTSITPNPRQPRTTIDPDELGILADSIRTRHHPAHRRETRGPTGSIRPHRR
ncbi:MAG: hypothetical protein R2848_06630 [Thermomicrobiales bacterium]